MKMSYKGTAPKGVPAINTSSNQTSPKIMKGARAAGEKYKKVGDLTLRGKGATDKSSGQSLPVRQSNSDKTRYSQAKQPVQYSNAATPKATTFVC